jgi:hypothetical protein
MADTVSLQDIVTRARARADMATSSFVADSPELEATVRALASELHGKLVEARGQEYYSITVPAFPLDHETPVVVLQPDFMKLLAVRVAGPGFTTDGDGGEGRRVICVPNGDWHTIHRFDPTHIARYRTMNSRKEDPCSPHDFAYRLGGVTDAGDFQTGFDQLTVYPVTWSTDWLLEYDYIPTAYFNTDGGSSSGLAVYIDTVNRWDEWIVYRLAADLLAKEERDTSYCERGAARIEARISALAPTRDASPQRLRPRDGFLGGSDRRHDRRLPR